MLPAHHTHPTPEGVFIKEVERQTRTHDEKGR
jgi:hypothetical protein